MEPAIKENENEKKMPQKAQIRYKLKSQGLNRDLNTSCICHLVGGHNSLNDRKGI